ncbi:MAG TPA: DeoR family transcriptional regulator [Candidatus Pacearchaeota archaeon]|nr:DeoR family transcriptional regulator [Candidatus Pacearchaeota archaeon]HOK94060.1 DeoR family transcriptional regulator [Candidatus Pacearchaeota archaeon]HPO75131.1 DeoR family transcriptional regulator [Candidatus Pacearchaeota archaeon]
MEKRQEKILKCVVKEYIKTAEPVSSQMLAENYNLNVSPATIRWDMVELTEKGYLWQPYCSAGRIPTEKAYRFFIKKFCQPRLSSEVEKRIEEVFTNQRDREGIIRELGKLMALVSKNLSIVFWERNFFWQGLSYLLSQPEFYQPEEILEIVEAFEELYDKIEKEDIGNDIKIYIGRENPFSREESLSLILGGLEDGVVGILGPIRMDYQKNIALVRKVKEILEEI